MNDTSDLEARIRRIEDHENIRLLSAVYNRALDDQDVEAFANCWTLDAIFRADTTSGTVEVTGREAVVKLCSTSNFGSVHVAADHVIDVTDTTAAQVLTVVLATRSQTRAEGSNPWSGTARYVDQLVRTEVGWLFSSRWFKPDAFLPQPWPPSN